jgi:MFS family permease
MVGFSGLSYSWDVLATDVTSLRNRGLAFTFNSSPALISPFGGSKAAAGFVASENWRWGYGMVDTILPGIALPIDGILAHYLQGVIFRDKCKWGSSLEGVWWAIIVFDWE